MSERSGSRTLQSRGGKMWFKIQLLFMSIVFSSGTTVSSQCRTRTGSRVQPKGMYVLNCYLHTLTSIIFGVPRGISVYNLTSNNFPNLQVRRLKLGSQRVQLPRPSKARTTSECQQLCNCFNYSHLYRNECVHSAES